MCGLSGSRRILTQAPRQEMDEGEKGHSLYVRRGGQVGESIFQDPEARKMAFLAESTMASTPGCFSRRSTEMA
jgi:hypothetical protein